MRYKGSQTQTYTSQVLSKKYPYQGSRISRTTHTRAQSDPRESSMACLRTQKGRDKRERRRDEAPTLSLTHSSTFQCLYCPPPPLSLYPSLLSLSLLFVFFGRAKNFDWNIGEVNGEAVAALIVHPPPSREKEEQRRRASFPCKPRGSTTGWRAGLGAEMQLISKEGEEPICFWLRCGTPALYAQSEAEERSKHPFSFLQKG